MGVTDKKVVEIRLYIDKKNFLQRKVTVKKKDDQELKQKVDDFKSDWPLISSNLYKVEVIDVEQDV